MSEKALEVLVALHRDRDQLGPGSDASTARAFAMLPADLALGARACVLDLGCGTGRQTLALARLAPDATIVAVDLAPELAARAKARVAAAGLADRVEVRVGSMTDPALSAERAALVWSEGAVYNVGVAEALAAWRGALVPGGCVAFTELGWLGDARPEPARAFWAESYPAMRGVDENLALVEAAGYVPLGHFTLPASDWWAYYDGLAPAFRALEAAYANDPEALAVLADQRAEQDLYRAHGTAYGYTFYLAHR